MNLTFQTETGGRYDINPAHLSAENTFSFLSDGSIFIYYDAGDCDVMLPYVDLCRR